jgi:hypothetical protein
MHDIYLVIFIIEFLLSVYLKKFYFILYFIHSLKRIRGVYEGFLLPEEQLIASQALIQRLPEVLATLTLPHGGATAIPFDWPFRPIVARMNSEPKKCVFPALFP